MMKKIICIEYIKNEQKNTKCWERITNVIVGGTFVASNISIREEEKLKTIKLIT